MSADVMVNPEAFKGATSGALSLEEAVLAVWLKVQVVFGSVVIDSSKVWALC
jgi:hypothetical protein